MALFVIAVIILVCVIIAANIKIVPQAHVYVVERLGTYMGSWGAGLHFKLPFVDRIARKISLKEQVADFEPQAVITKDNVTMQIDTVVYFQVTDTKLFTYGVENPMAAIDNLCATTLRSIVGEMELDATLSSRDVINTKITTTLDEATDKWGIKINRVELKSIIPPPSIQEAMERQMRAERQRRESILVAEGEKQAAILVAEGKKASAILEADAVRERKIREAQGEAESIMAVQKAKADSMLLLKRAEAESISMIKEAGADEVVLKLRSLDAFAAAADGKANKLIIPSGLTNVTSLASVFGEAAQQD